MGSIDRERLRRHLRCWRDVQRRMALERALEELDDENLARLFEGLVRLDEYRCASALEPALTDRVREHVAATRRGEFLGNYRLNAPHGERAPWQTDAWNAATHHLFSLVLTAARRGEDDALDALRELVGLVEEVDERADEFVVYEDDDHAAFTFHTEVREARKLMSPRPDGGGDMRLHAE